MGKRKYTHIQGMLPEVKAMRTAGKSYQEIAEHLGLKDKKVIKKLLERERKKERNIAAGILPRSNGEPFAAGFSAAHRKGVRPKVKYHIIYLHRRDYPISTMCSFFEVSRSGYYGREFLLYPQDRVHLPAENCHVPES